MSRMWLKNGRAVLENGRAVLCNECPCGCRYTYYVDHSLEASGDGHSWETAFNSLNNVFNSTVIRDYRLAGCVIYVIIRGNVDYQITGTYRGNIYYANIWLCPENNESVIACNPPENIGLFNNSFYHVIFYHWDFLLVCKNSNTIRIMYSQFRGCHFASNIVFYENGETDILVISGFGHRFSDCDVAINVSGTKSGATSWVFCEGVDVVASNMIITSLDTRSSATLARGVVFNYTSNSIYENITIEMGSNNTNTERLFFVGFSLVYGDPCVFSSCLVNFDIIIDGSFYTQCCAFGGSTSALFDATFYDCTQNCIARGYDPQDYCENSCIALS